MCRLAIEGRTKHLVPSLRRTTLLSKFLNVARRELECSELRSSEKRLFTY